MKFKQPNFDYEWEEARLRKNLFNSKEEWLEIAKNGHPKKINCSMNLSNTDMCLEDQSLEDLDKDKVKRALESIKKGSIELPIILHVEDRYEVLAGNTRLTAMNKANLPVYAWVINLPGKTIKDLEIDGYNEEDFYNYQDMEKSKLTEKWSEKYKNSIDCNNPKGFSQRAHCQGKKKQTNENIKGGLSDNMTLKDIAKKHKVDINDLKIELSKGMKVEMEHTNSKKIAQEIAMDHLFEDPKYYSKLKKIETKESTTAGSSGSYEGSPVFGDFMSKKQIYKIHNSKMNESEQEVDEAMDASSSGAYDVPLFGKTPKGRKNPLSIEGPKSIYSNRAVKDKKFPKYGGPEGIYVKVKEKCKKFPYCNQGNTGALEFIKEDQEIQFVIREVSKELNLPYIEIEKLVLNEINKIFIEYEN